MKIVANALVIFIIVITMSCDKSVVKNDTKYVIELISSDFNSSKIKSIAQNNGVNDTQLYQWNNHLVLYSQINSVDELSKELVKEFPDMKVKIYHKPFYNFSKSERCLNSSIAKEWKHILLTANLVEDEKMQQEYLDYHSTQFAEWPGVAEGFCNANFQQLLLYRNGRQLMLVISIPADKTLDELNPKTTENNPQMDVWNSIMGKYQEGIDGTEPNEKWVFLSKQ